MVQTEDGGTLAVQVEYLDEELYDRIFGAPDLQMAGSLPDLPNNQVGRCDGMVEPLNCCERTVATSCADNKLAYSIALPPNHNEITYAIAI